MTAKKPAAVLSVEDIITSDDRNTVDVEVPEWGGVVRVQSFTKAQQVAIRRSASASLTGGDIDVDEFERQVFLAGLVDPEVTPDQYNLLMEKNAQAMDRIVKEILRINGMAEDTEKQVAATFQD
jgi:hypothetical protein